MPTSTEEMNQRLYKAAIIGNKEDVKILIDNGANMEAPDEYGNTALINATICGHTETIKALLSKGVNIDAVNQFGNTALKLASKNGVAEIIKEHQAAKDHRTTPTSLLWRTAKVVSVAKININEGEIPTVCVAVIEAAGSFT